MSAFQEHQSEHPIPDVIQVPASNKKEIVRTETIDAVLVVTIDRPEVRNAIDGPTAAALAHVFRTFDADPSLSVAVLTGAGNTFCSGLIWPPSQTVSEPFKLPKREMPRRESRACC